MVLTHFKNELGIIRFFKGDEGKSMIVIVFICFYHTRNWQNIGELVYVSLQVFEGHEIRKSLDVKPVVTRQTKQATHTIKSMLSQVFLIRILNG